ncbi:MAG: hypothetical protein QOJ00_2375, partial [Actinomycetota bacterium]
MRKLAAGLACLCVLVLVPGAARADSSRPVVDVIQIGGLLDRVQADFFTHAVHDADATHAAALVVQLDSSRSVLPQKRLAALRSTIRRAATPVGMWVGPARSGHVGGQVSTLLGVADVVGLAPGASVDTKRVGIDVRSPTLGDFLVDLDGVRGVSIPTKVIRSKGDTPRREPLVDVRFAKPTLTARTIHGVTSPGPAYALLMFGLLLMVLEFATAGIGLAAGTAAI